jgi:hypothetical protein
MGDQRSMIRKDWSEMIDDDRKWRRGLTEEVKKTLVKLCSQKD